MIQTRASNARSGRQRPCSTSLRLRLIAWLGLTPSQPKFFSRAVRCASVSPKNLSVSSLREKSPFTCSPARVGRVFAALSPGHEKFSLRPSVPSTLGLLRSPRVGTGKIFHVAILIDHH